MADDYSSFFLNTPSKVIKMQTLEISHPNFSRNYYIVRNATKGLTATLENSQEVFFEYYPCEIKAKGSYNDLDQCVEVSFGDLGEILPVELDNIARAKGFGQKPTVRYREYRSDNLSKPMLGPWNLEITPISFDGKNATFEAAAPKLNINGTGRIYNLSGTYRTLRTFI